MLKTFSSICAVVLLACGGSSGNPADGSPDAASSSSGCDLVGTWNVSRGGSTATYEVHANGTTLLSLGTFGTKIGTWSLDGNRLSVTDTSATGAENSCPPSQVGVYDLAWAADCNSVTLTAVDDPCATRKQIVDGMTVTR